MLPLRKAPTARRAMLLPLTLLALAACSPSQTVEVEETARIGPALGLPVDFVLGQT